MDVHLGMEGTKSNGHGEGKDDNMNKPLEICRNISRFTRMIMKSKE
jgi:hypothetical protein